MTPDSVEGNWGVTQLAPGITPIQGCIIEIVSTFVLVFTAFSVNDENRRDVKGSTPLAMGICVCAIVMCSVSAQNEFSLNIKNGEIIIACLFFYRDLSPEPV